MSKKSFIGDPIFFNGAGIFVNPGSGPVDGASESYAIANIPALIIDAIGDIPVSINRISENDRNGRFAFTLAYGERKCLVDMPGLPLEQVRYIGAEGQNIWDFPRLYVDGSSWVWEFAINEIKYALIAEQ